MYYGNYHVLFCLQWFSFSKVGICYRYMEGSGSLVFVVGDDSKKTILPGASWMGNGEFAWRGRTWCERRCVLGVVVLVLVFVLVLALFVLAFVLLVPVLVIVVFFLLLFLLFHLFFFLIVLVIVIAVVSVVEMFHHNSTTLYYIYLMHCKIEWIWKWWDWQGVPRSANLQ